MKFLLAGLLLITQSFTVFSMQKKEIYLAGGCYWGLEYLLQDLPGVLNTEVGFSGGSLENATYDDVKTGSTGHAETIHISYDEKVISLEQLLFEFFRMHNPTTKTNKVMILGLNIVLLFFISMKNRSRLLMKSLIKSIKVVIGQIQW